MSGERAAAGALDTLGPQAGAGAGAAPRGPRPGRARWPRRRDREAGLAAPCIAGAAGEGGPGSRPASRGEPRALPRALASLPAGGSGGRRPRPLSARFVPRAAGRRLQAGRALLQTLRAPAGAPHRPPRHPGETLPRRPAPSAPREPDLGCRVPDLGCLWRGAWAARPAQWVSVGPRTRRSGFIQARSCAPSPGAGRCLKEAATRDSHCGRFPLSLRPEGDRHPPAPDRAAGTIWGPAGAGASPSESLPLRVRGTSGGRAASRL